MALRTWSPTPADAAALAAAWADPEIARWTAVPDDASSAAATRWIAVVAAPSVDAPSLDLVIIDPAQPATVLGEVGLVVVDRARRLLEVGYWIAAPHRGQGRAAAAVDQAVTWVLDPSVGWATVIARVDPANPASGAVARRSGFGPAGSLADGRVLWRRDAP